MSSADQPPPQKAIPGVGPAEAGFGQFIFHLHPESGSSMEQWLVGTRDVVAKNYGMDDSYLYPPHVSMSGWVHTTHEKMGKVAIRLGEMIEERLTRLASMPEGKPVAVGVGQSCVGSPTGATNSEIVKKDNHRLHVNGSVASLTASTAATVSPGASKEGADFALLQEDTIENPKDSSSGCTGAPSGSDEQPGKVLEVPASIDKDVGRQISNSSMRGYRGSGYISSEKTTCSAFPVPPDQVAFLGRILTTETGYVLNDLSSAFLHQLMLDIDFETADDVVIKGKPINHITLANCREDAADRDAIMEIYTREFCRYIKAESPTTRWQMVVFEMKRRTPKGKVAEQGPHSLHKFATIPVWLK